MPSVDIGKISNRCSFLLIDILKLIKVPRCNRRELANDTVPLDLISCLT